MLKVMVIWAMKKEQAPQACNTTKSWTKRMNLLENLKNLQKVLFFFAKTEDRSSALIFVVSIKARISASKNKWETFPRTVISETNSS